MVIELFLTGSVPKEEKSNELHVVVEQDKKQSTPGGNLIDLTQQKKKLDLRQYVLEEYKSMKGLGKNFDHKSM